MITILHFFLLKPGSCLCQSTFCQWEFFRDPLLFRRYLLAIRARPCPNFQHFVRGFDTEPKIFHAAAVRVPGAKVMKLRISNFPSTQKPPFYNYITSVRDLKESFKVCFIRIQYPLFGLFTKTCFCATMARGIPQNFFRGELMKKRIVSFVAACLTLSR